MKDRVTSADIVIIGSGMGGSTLAYALRDLGARVLVLERGDFLPTERQNWEAPAVFGGRYKTTESWVDGDGRPYTPGMHYWVGGNTKVFGAALTRFRREDFGVLAHHGGESPAWPVSYEEIERYYVAAERLYRVHGELGEDPTEPAHSAGYPFPSLPHEPTIAKLAESLRAQGLHPAHLPMAIDYRPGGRCVWCSTCDGFPCLVRAKSDAEVCALRPALAAGNVEITPRAKVVRLTTDTSGSKVVSAEIEHDGEVYQVRADTFVLAAGAANTAAVLLRGGDRGQGLANKSGQVGRNYMQQNMTALMAVALRKPEQITFQKTLAVHDFYLAGEHWNYPMGSAATFGKLNADILHTARPRVPTTLLGKLAARSTDWWLMSEDLPDPENRVTLSSSGRITVTRRVNNYEAHQRLVRAVSKMLSSGGFPIVFRQKFGLETNSHHCGTARMGADAAHSVVDDHGQAHDIPNLYIVDSSVFPASAALNPSLTIAALALRTARDRFGAAVLPGASTVGQAGTASGTPE
jgi:choline dehydrogenase-like flavoprotein